MGRTFVGHRQVICGLDDDLAPISVQRDKVAVIGPQEVLAQPDHQWQPETARHDCDM